MKLGVSFVVDGAWGVHRDAVGDGGAPLPAHAPHQDHPDGPAGAAQALRVCDGDREGSRTTGHVAQPAQPAEALQRGAGRE